VADGGQVSALGRSPGRIPHAEPQGFVLNEIYERGLRMSAYQSQATIPIERDFADDLYRLVLSDLSWSAALNWLRGQFGATDAALFVLDVDIAPRFAATERVRDLCSRYVESGEWRVHELYGRALVGLAKAKECPLPASLRGKGLGEAMSFAFKAPNDCRAVILLWKGDDDRPFTDEEYELGLSLAPQLATALRLSHSLIVDRARPTLAVLAAIGTAAAVFGSDGRIVAVNERFENCRDIWPDAASGLVKISDELANQRLQNAVEEVRGRRARARAIAVPARDGRGPLVLWVLAVSGLDDPMAPHSACLLIVTAPPESRRAPASAILSTLFDLTPSEARFLSVLAQGGTLAEIAETLKLSVKSARTYLDRIFAKTATHRQIDLMLLLRDIQGPGIDN
jgi:DNA-binding CsgD family transcriptional regulator